MSEIVVVGSLNMDLAIESPRIPRMGETIIGGNFRSSPGGKGSNQAVAAARLGGKVCMVGCVGNDIFGQDVIENLINNGVNVDNIRKCDDAATGTALITIVNGDNCIIIDAGANYKISLDDISRIENLIKNCKVLVTQLEIPIPIVERAIEIAKKHNVKVILNPAPAQKLSDDLLKNVDIITPNETETEILTGIKPDSRDNIENAISYFRKKGINQVIITLGKDGVVYNDKDNIVFKKAISVNVVDTTAAGDSFTGALAVKVSEGASIGEIIDFCNIVGALTVTKRGAQESLPTLAEVEAFKVGLKL